MNMRVHTFVLMNGKFNISNNKNHEISGINEKMECNIEFRKELQAGHCILCQGDLSFVLDQGTLPVTLIEQLGISHQSLKNDYCSFILWNCLS